MSSNHPQFIIAHDHIRDMQRAADARALANLAGEKRPTTVAILIRRLANAAFRNRFGIHAARPIVARSTQDLTLVG